MVINLIYCDLPNAKAISEESEDVDTHNMREEIKHELMHIINDDFYLDEHVNLVEQMVRRTRIDDAELENIDFYHHYVSVL